jgi:AcrR family transcriptional regulator
MEKRAQYHPGDLRAGLVEAVRGLVETHGPDRFSVADACRAAGVSTAAPYRHFTDKDEMLLAVAMEGMARQHEQLAQATLGRIPGSDDALIAMGLAYVAFAQAEPGVFRLMFGLTRTHGDHPDIIARGMETYGLLLAQIAARLGRDAQDDQVLARAFPFWTFVHGLSFLLIDEKITALCLTISVPDLIGDFTRRMLADCAGAA